MSKKNSIDTIVNRTRDLPACNAVPQPTAPPRTPYCNITLLLSMLIFFSVPVDIVPCCVDSFHHVTA